MAEETEMAAGFRVFIGNLPFKVTETEIEELLKPFGEVVEVKLARRMNRFLGFAFAVFKDKAAADEAVAKLHKVEFQERALNVEAAHPSSERKPRREPAVGSEHSGAESQGEDRPRRRRPDGRRRRPRRAPEEGEEGQHHEDGEGYHEDGAGRGRGGGRGGRGGRGGDRRRAPRPEGAVSDDGAGASRGGRGRRRPARDRAGLPDSETLLFVSNLPYTYTDDDLAKVFAGLSFTSARVVKRASTGMGRGFGFVDMSDHKGQTEALDKINGKEFDGRVVTVKIAKERQPDEQTDAPAPAQ